MSDTETADRPLNREAFARMAYQVLSDAEKHARELAGLIAQWKERFDGGFPRSINDLFLEEKIDLGSKLHQAVRITEVGAEQGITIVTLEDGGLYCRVGTKTRPISRGRHGTSHNELPIYITWRRQLNEVLDDRIWTQLLQETDNQIEMAIHLIRGSLE